MADLNLQLVEFIRTAYRQLKDDPSDNATFIQYRESDEKYIEYIMQKKSWYFGEWVVFDGTRKMMTVDKKFMESLFPEQVKND